MTNRETPGFYKFRVRKGHATPSTPLSSAGGVCRDRLHTGGDEKETEERRGSAVPALLRSLGIGDGNGFGDASRAIRAFEFDRRLADHAQTAVLRVFGAFHAQPGADAAARRHRRSEADAVGAVVQTVRHPVDAVDLVDHLRQQREGEKAVSDGRAARQFARGALAIDVDPLEVARRLGEFVDSFLRHIDPRADADLFAHQGFHRIETLDYTHSPLSSRCAPPRRSGMVKPCCAAK